MMIYIAFILWITNALLLLLEKRIIRLLIFMGSFSVVTALVYLLLAAPDLAMAEVAISSFTTVFFIICFEKYYLLSADKKDPYQTKQEFDLKRYGIPILLTGAMFFLFVTNLPEMNINDSLARLYIENFNHQVGGLNSITAIYLGYRMFDTMFEALILVIAVAAVGHMSFYADMTVKSGKMSGLKNSKVTMFTLRMLAPFVLIYGIYVIINGHLGPGGGFQGGLMIAIFFVCRYMAYDIYDMPIKKILKLEEYIFIITVIFAILLVFSGVMYYLPVNPSNPTVQSGHLILMNSLIGLKVACGFIILFYRYIAIERR